jgi:hypothetical protein
MISTFFKNLKKFSAEQAYKLSNYKKNETINNDNDNLIAKAQQQIRFSLLARLQFLSFIFSNLGSPCDFEMSNDHLEILWQSLIRFDDVQQYQTSTQTQTQTQTTTPINDKSFDKITTIDINNKTTTEKGVTISIKDDLFNWLLNQAKQKDQHATSIEKFKFIFVSKMPLLDPNSFSQTALHLYQELFRIYKYSFQQQQTNKDEDREEGDEDGEDALKKFRQMENSAIDYIAKLAFKSANSDVSLAAVQFLNAHYVHTDTIASVEHENSFIQLCMSFLNEACQTLSKSKKKK